MVKKNDLLKIIRKLTCLSVKLVLDGVDTNLIGMLNDRDIIWGKLHLLSNTNQIPGGSAVQIVQFINQGQQLPYVPPTIAQEQQNYLIEYHRDHGPWLDNQASKEALKEFILTRVDEIYLELLYEQRIWYKGKTLW